MHCFVMITAETANIFVEDFVTSTYNFNIHLEFKPGTLKGRVFNFDNRIYAEYKQVLQWHQLIPDQVDVQGLLLSQPFAYLAWLFGWYRLNMNWCYKM